MNSASVIVLMVIFGLAGLAIYRNLKKKGGGCGCGCEHCSGHCHGGK